MYSNLTQEEKKKTLSKLRIVCIIIVFCITLSSGIATYIVGSSLHTYKYESTATLIVYPQTDNVPAEPENTPEKPESETPIPICIELIKSDNILDEVRDGIYHETNEKYTVSAIRKMMTVENIKNTYVIEITVECENPVMARELVNEIATVSEKRMPYFLPIVQLLVVDDGKASVTPSNANTPLVYSAVVSCIVFLISSIVAIIIFVRKKRN